MPGAFGPPGPGVVGRGPGPSPRTGLPSPRSPLPPRPRSPSGRLPSRLAECAPSVRARATAILRRQGSRPHGLPAEGSDLERSTASTGRRGGTDFVRPRRTTRAHRGISRETHAASPPRLDTPRWTGQTTLPTGAAPPTLDDRRDAARHHRAARDRRSSSARGPPRSSERRVRRTRRDERAVRSDTRYSERRPSASGSATDSRTTYPRQLRVTPAPHNAHRPSRPGSFRRPLVPPSSHLTR